MAQPVCASDIVIAFISDLFTRCFSTSACRHRMVNLRRPRPRHLERRILEAITQPIYPKQFIDPGKLCAVIENEKKKSSDVEESLVQAGIYVVEL